MHADPIMSARLDRLRERGTPAHPVNGTTWKRLAQAEIVGMGKRDWYGAGAPPLPLHMPPIEVALPDGDWPAPDYFTYGMFSFSSQRLRDALALGAAVIQHLPIHLVAGGAKAKGQDYRLFRPLCHQPGLDTERSEYITDSPNPGPASPVGYSLLVTLAIQPGLVPCADLFWLDEEPTRLIATDSLALRVLKAKCSGIWFQDPATIGLVHGKVRLRNTRGVTMRKYW